MSKEALIELAQSLAVYALLVLIMGLAGYGFATLARNFFLGCCLAALGSGVVVTLGNSL